MANLDFFIKRRAVSWVLTIAIAIAGAFSFITLPRDLQPDITIPYAVVTTFLPGANPIDTEELVTKPLEKEIGTISSIKTIQSTSGQGLSLIVIEFAAGEDIDKEVSKLEKAVNRAQVDLPDDTTTPLVAEQDVNTQPIINFSISSNIPQNELTEIAEDIRDELENVPNVSRVDILGSQEKIIEVEVDQKKANGYGLTLKNISDIIEFSKANIPIGIVSSGKLNYSLRIENTLESLNTIRNIPLFVTQDKTTILLKDVATVKEGLPEQRTISKLTTSDTKQSKKTITLQVLRKKNSNALTVADATKAKFTELQKEIGKNIEVAITNDNSFFIREDFKILTSNGLQTTILIIIALFLALGLLEGLMAGLIIPVTLLFAFAAIDFLGLTLNSLSIFSLVIALGIMVDNSIVIMEGIHENMKSGQNSYDAAVNSIRIYLWPLVAGTATTIFAFLPMLLVGGIVGEFMKTLPITITAALLGSLFIALTLGPSLTAKFLEKRKIKEGKASILEPFFNKLGDIFHHIIYGVLHKKILRVLIILSFTGLFIASMAMPITGILQAELFPKTDVHFFIVNIETPKGTVIEQTEKVVNKVEEKIKKIPEVENFLSIIGTNASQAQTDIVSTGGTTESNLANITVNLVPKEERTRKSYIIADELRNELNSFTEAKVEVQELSEGPPSEAPVTVRITGEDISKLEEISKHIIEVTKKIPGTSNVKSSLEEGLNEFKFELDPEKVAQFNLNLFQVGSIIRDAIQGISPMKVTINNEEMDIFVKYDLPEKNNKTNLSIKEITNLQIPTPSGSLITFDQLGETKFTNSFSEIDREDQERIVRVTSDLGKGISPVIVTNQIKENLKSYKTPKGYEIKFGGDVQDINENFKELYYSMIIAIILIGFTLVLMFNSLKQPFIILLTLPMALIGVFPGLFILGLKLSFPAFLGIVALTGVVVNDAIVMIDRINENRKEKVEFTEAIAETAKSRIQPIFMTSITTILGILPLAMSNEFWAGLGYSLCFGLAFSTILTLLLVPILYYIFEEKSARRELRQ